MIGMSAVIFIPDDTAKTGYPQPLMLQSVMGAPLLAWLANALFDSGVGRFFLVCHDRYVEAARACLPAEAEVMLLDLVKYDCRRIYDNRNVWLVYQGIDRCPHPARYARTTRY